MFTILLILTLFLLFFIFAQETACYRKSFIQAVLSVLTLLFIFTEVLSFFDKITPFYVGLCWGVTCVTLFALFLYKHVQIKNIFKQIHIEKEYLLIIIVASILIILPLGFIALYYPPNTGDSMVYHLPRIEHWVQNKNIGHYPTPDTRQLFHQPFGEFILLHLRLLAGSDFWFNMLQFFLMLCSLILVSLITKLFGLDYKYQILSSILALTIPMGIMQATSTQTDYVAAFFVLAFIYFALLLMQQDKVSYTSVIFCSLALGLGILTKFTAAIFAAPFCLWLACSFIKKYKKHALKAVLPAIVIITALNTPFYVRNYMTTGAIVGDTHISNMMKNDALNIPLFFSNIIRNVTIHLSLPIQCYNSFIDTIVEKLHYHLLKISPHEKAISFLSEKYRTCFFMNDGYAGNFLLLILIIFLFLFCLRHREILWYTLSLIAGFLIFCAVFKWQPWHSRLQLPFFVGAVPAVTFFLYKICSDKRSWVRITFTCTAMGLFSLLNVIFLLSKDPVHTRIFYFMLTVFLLIIILFKKLKTLDILTRTVIMPLILLALPYVFFNTTRPLLLNKPVVTSSRDQKYFVSQWSDEYYRQYATGAQLLQSLNIKKLAVSLDYLYPVWPMFKSKNHEIEIQEINFKDIYRSTRNFNKNFAYQSVFTNSDTIIRTLTKF